MGESYYAACQSAQEQDMIEAKAVAPFLKDGEQPSECIKRWRADALAVLELLTQEKVKSETLAAEVAKLRDEVEMLGEKADEYWKELVKLRAACGQMREALVQADAWIVGADSLPLDETLVVIAAALETDAGRGWVSTEGAVESEVITAALANGAWVDAIVPDSWAGKPVLIVPKPEGWK